MPPAPTKRQLFSPLASGYALSLAVVFALLVAVPFISPARPTSSPPAYSTNPAWVRAGDNIAACCRVQAYGRAVPLIEKRLKTNNFDDLLFMGGFYRDWGRWDEARKYYDMALQIAEGEHDKQRLVVVLNNIALAYFSEGLTEFGKPRTALLAKSEGMYARARSLCKQIDDASLRDTVQHNYAALLLEKGRAAEARL